MSYIKRHNQLNEKIICKPNLARFHHADTPKRHLVPENDARNAQLPVWVKSAQEKCSIKQGQRCKLSLCKRAFANSIGGW